VSARRILDAARFERRDRLVCPGEHAFVIDEDALEHVDGGASSIGSVSSM